MQQRGPNTRVLIFGGLAFVIIAIAGVVALVIGSAVSDGVSCSVHSEEVTASPDRETRALHRTEFCGGAAGSSKGAVYLLGAGQKVKDAEDPVVTTGHAADIGKVSWRGNQVLVVEVAPRDEFGDPVNQQTEEASVELDNGTSREVRIQLVRRLLPTRVE